MFVCLLSLIIIMSVHGNCTDRTCIYGQCINNTCQCDTGVKGELCNMDIIDCDAEACSNNGTCIELMNGFACQCLPDFDGSRCQYRRTIADNHCKKKCFNHGKCIVINNTQKCACLPNYSGSKCEYTRKNNSIPSVPKCSVLKYRRNHHEATCLAISLTPLFDVLCECHYDGDRKQFVKCQITPSPYSTQTCSFRRSLSPGTLSTLHEAITIHVCPVNWQILDQYETTQEILHNVHITRCQLL